MTLLCITHSMDRIRSCTIRGYHLDGTADGHEDRPGHECQGCLPRPAEHGLLCRLCFEKYEEALGRARDLITHLRSVERSGQSVDGVRSSQIVQPTIPPSWSEADNLWMLLSGVIVGHAADTGADEPKWPYWTSPAIGFSFSATLDMVSVAVRDAVLKLRVYPEAVVSIRWGAEGAVMFYRGMQRALARFPLEDRVTHQKWIRCRYCKHNSILLLPPLELGDDQVLKCQFCENEYDPAFTDWDMRVWAEEEWKRRSEPQREEILSRLQPDERKVLDQSVKAVLLLSEVVA